MGSEQRNAVLAVVLSGLILFGWQTYFAPKQVPAPIEPTNQAKVEKTEIQPATGTPGPIEPAVDQTFNLTRQGVSLDFTSSLTVTSMANPQAAFSFDNTVFAKDPLNVQFDFGEGFTTIRFVKTDVENKFYNAAHDVTLVTGMDEKGMATFNITSSKDFRFRFVFKSKSDKLENGQQRYFSIYTDELTHYDIGDEDNGDRAIKWAGIDFNYHLFAVVFDKAPTLLYKNTEDNKFLMYSSKGQKTLSYSLVFVKKEFNYLSSLGHNLKGSVDFGFWGFFAVWILKGLQFFYKFFPNYGVAIILLTLIVRLITFPLQYKSVVSMKKLQLVQPELTKIREKYKDDPARMQKESMELFRKSGANPIGGCLPLLLQMPVFFAFYKVLYSSVELVDAPFILWIQDLSNKDPYFVLPILMTGAMFLQQKLTPNTISDPVQKKVMMFMPLVFGFIMKDLPAGLSLYIFVSTLFGILQQVLVFRTKASDKPVVV